MFTCSSCGYEANPDSAPACSLCGTKKPVKAGAEKEATAAKSAPASAAASSASGSSSSSSSSSSASGSSSATKSEPKKAAKSDELDELASAAKAVADSATGMPAVSSKGARGGKLKAGTNEVVVTTTGILRMSAPAPPIENAVTLMGAFVGALLGYVIQWHRIGGAPASLGDLAIPTAIGIVFALVARLLIAPALEESLTYQAKINVHGPMAGMTGGALAIFALVGFFAASRAAPSNQQNAATTGAPIDGTQLAQRLALLTPWTVSIKTDKLVVLANKPKPELRIKCAKLEPDDVAAVSKATGLSTANLERLVANEPLGNASAPLPLDFQLDVFLDRIATVYGVLKDQPRQPKETRVGTLLVRRRKSGVDELLSLPQKPKMAIELQPALPQGVPIWVGVSLGIAHDSTSDHDALVNAVYDQYRPAD